jgi:hypothetical protein
MQIAQPRQQKRRNVMLMLKQNAQPSWRKRVNTQLQLHLVLPRSRIAKKQRPLDGKNMESDWKKQKKTGKMHLTRCVTKLYQMDIGTGDNDRHEDLLLCDACNDKVDDAPFCPNCEDMLCSSCLELDPPNYPDDEEVEWVQCKNKNKAGASKCTRWFHSKCITKTAGFFQKTSLRVRIASVVFDPSVLLTLLLLSVPTVVSA